MSSEIAASAPVDSRLHSIEVAAQKRELSTGQALL